VDIIIGNFWLNGKDRSGRKRAGISIWYGKIAREHPVPSPIKVPGTGLKNRFRRP
jgi:hypothetical protein